jgi:hypothetical protein
MNQHGRLDFTPIVKKSVIMKNIGRLWKSSLLAEEFLPLEDFYKANSLFEHTYLMGSI